MQQIAKDQAKLQYDTLLGLLNKDLYSKRFNFLIHAVSENSDHVWENRNLIEKLFKSFLIEGLNININQEIKIVDVHRLPQYPMFFKNKIKIDRPIIVKLKTPSQSKDFVYRQETLNNIILKEKKSPSLPYVFVTKHLPKELQQRTKKMSPEYKQTKAQRKRY